MNLILIAIDTLSARHMSCYGYPRQTTPFIDTVAQKGVQFDAMYCQAIPTQPSYTSIFTGQYAVTHGIVNLGGNRDLKLSAPWLPQILQANGYTTCAVDNLYYHKPWFSKGYEFYINPRLSGPYAQAEPADQFNKRAIPWLKAHADEKFFMFVHYWDPHTPYLPPKYRNLFYPAGQDPCDPQNHSLDGLWKHPMGDAWKRWFDQLKPGITDAEYIAAMYDSEIRCADDGVRELLETLEGTGAADETLVIITSDHGEMMADHGIYFDHHGLYDPDIHVPLIMQLPKGWKGGARVPHLVQHIDIAPTILDFAGISTTDNPANKMDGQSLLPYIRGKSDQPIYPYLVAEECTRMMKWALRTDNYKYILARQQDYRNYPMEELYDLKADPGELHNLVGERPEIAAGLRAILEDWVAVMMQKNGWTEDPLLASGLTLGTDWVKWVKEHGYW